jgi:hypothetical protein
MQGNAKPMRAGRLNRNRAGCFDLAETGDSGITEIRYGKPRPSAPGTGAAAIGVRVPGSRPRSARSDGQKETGGNRSRPEFRRSL